MSYDVKWLDEKGLCHKCGSQKKFPGRQFCPSCLEKIAEYNAKRYDPQKAHEYQARRRELYQQKKAAGACVRCNKPATHGMYCYEHSIEAKRHNQINSQRRKRERHERGLTPEYRKDNGLCLWCGSPASPGYQACEEHRKIFSEASMKGDKTAWKAIRNLIWKGIKNG